MTDTNPIPFISEDHAPAQIKRFLELWAGDPEFRRASVQITSSRQRFLDDAGIKLQASDLDLFWRALDAQRCGRPDGNELERQLIKDPLWTLWASWNRRIRERCQRHAGEWLKSGNKRFDAWRNRVKSRTQSESVPIPDQGYVPLLFAFELSKGCSKQCWFCAFDPPKLEGYFSYTDENKRLWRSILGAAWELFGPACRVSVCYHSTEPTDNPDYLWFLRDFHDICGIHPHTTTASPLKDIEWTRELLRLRDANPHTQDRFSVLSLRSLRNIFRTFSAEEMKSVQLALQYRGAVTVRNHCGRALRHAKLLQTEVRLIQETKAGGLFVPKLTVECTVGYLVNMVDRSIKLVSPCNASKRWPLGYVIHAEGSFADAVEFRDFIDQSIAHCMQEHLGKDDRIAYPDSLQFDKLEDGFTLTDRYIQHAVRGNRHFGLLGELIRDGAFTTGDLTDRLIQDGMPVFEAISWLDRLYQKGLIQPTQED